MNVNVTRTLTYTLCVLWYLSLSTTANALCIRRPDVDCRDFSSTAWRDDEILTRLSEYEACEAAQTCRSHCYTDRGSPRNATECLVHSDYHFRCRNQDYLINFEDITLLSCQELTTSNECSASPDCSWIENDVILQGPFDGKCNPQKIYIAPGSFGGLDFGPVCLSPTQDCGGVNENLLGQWYAVRSALEGSLRFSMKKNSPTADWNLNDVSLSVYTMASVESAVTKIAGSMSSLSAGSISCAAYRTVDNTDVVVPSVTKNQVLYVLAAVQNTTEDLILGESLQGFRLEVSPGTATDNCAWNCRGYEDKINNATCICQETDTNEATSIVENVCELCDVNSTFCFWEYKSETVFGGPRGEMISDKHCYRITKGEGDFADHVNDALCLYTTNNENGTQYQYLINDKKCIQQANPDCDYTTHDCSAVYLPNTTVNWCDWTGPGWDHGILAVERDIFFNAEQTKSGQCYDEEPADGDDESGAKTTVFLTGAKISFQLIGLVLIALASS